MNYTVKLNDTYKSYTKDQDKILHPEETVKRFKDKLNTIDLDILKSAIHGNQKTDGQRRYPAAGRGQCLDGVG